MKASSAPPRHKSYQKVRAADSSSQSRSRAEEEQDEDVSLPLPSPADGSHGVNGEDEEEEANFAIIELQSPASSFKRYSRRPCVLSPST